MFMSAIKDMMDDIMYHARQHVLSIINGSVPLPFPFVKGMSPLDHPPVSQINCITLLLAYNCLVCPCSVHGKITKTDDPAATSEAPSHQVIHVLYFTILLKFSIM